MASPASLPVRGRRQRGAIAVVVAVLLATLVLLAGLVVDLGRLYVIKTELQNAADACALSAARELNDRSAGATARAKDAGVYVGNRNLVQMQSANVSLQRADVTFSETLEGATTDDVTANSVYAHCRAHGSAAEGVRVPLVFMTVGGLFAEAISEVFMDAVAVARPTPSQTFCAIPLAMCTARAGEPNYGFEVGGWYAGRSISGAGDHGAYGWVQFGGPGAADVAEVVAGPGICAPLPELVDAQHGVAQNVAQAWNTRFGLYSGTFNDLHAFPPDRTGWAFTPSRTVTKGGKTTTIPGSWPAGRDAYADYVRRKNTTHDPYDPATLLEDNGHPAVLPGNPAPLTRDLHASKGQDRRMVLAPIIRCAEYLPNGKNMEVLDWACALMLNPINDPDEDVRLEFRGSVLAGACGSTGIPGDFGPPVPALVK